MYRKMAKLEMIESIFLKNILAVSFLSIKLLTVQKMIDDVGEKKSSNNIHLLKISNSRFYSFIIKYHKIVEEKKIPWHEKKR